MADIGDPITEALLDTFGDELRGIGEYREDDYELLYIRPDIEEHYSEEEFDQIWKNMILESLRKDPLEDQYPGEGDYLYTSLGFEQSVVVVFPRSELSGLVVSIDRGFFSDWERLVTECLKHV